MTPKSKMHTKKKPSLLKDMDVITSDPRFSHIGADPKLRYMPKEKKKVKIDERFSTLMTDDRFYEKSTMDSRGRKGNFSTKDDLKRFYHMSDSGEDSDGEDTDLEEEKTTNKSSKLNKNSQKICQDDVLDDEAEDIQKKDDSKDEINNEQIPSKQKKKQIEEEKVPDGLKERLLKYDFSRGEAELTDSSDDDSSSSEEDEDEQNDIDEFEWGELDKDAIREDEENPVEETNRIAVCNMNWDRVNSTDLMLLFSSYIPASGSIKNVSIYLSDYGRQRLKEEDASGPQELVNTKRNFKELKKLEKGEMHQDSGSPSKNHIEAVRRYQRNRLRYYYAVVECDCSATAVNIYKECDRNVYEGSGNMIDLRYIPSDMTFDEDPIDICEKLPKNYTMRQFTTSALHDSTPVITWDETAAERKKDINTVMTQITKGQEPDYDRLQAYVGSCSESDDEDEEAKEKKKETAQKLRNLLTEIDDKEREDDERKQMFSDVIESKPKLKSVPKEIDEEELAEVSDIDDNEELDQSDSNESSDGSSANNFNKNEVKDFLSQVKGFGRDTECKTSSNQVDKMEIIHLQDKETSNIQKKTEQKKQKLTPFETFLEKRKQKRQEKLRNKTSKENSDVGSDEDSDSDKQNISDDELPEDMEDLANDPFFAEELKARSNKSETKNKNNNENTKKKKKNKHCKDDQQEGEDLELLLMNEDTSDKKHFNMRQIVEDANQNNNKKSKGRFSKKKSKREIENEKEKKKELNHFKVELDPRFSGLVSSSDYHIDPSHSSYKRTDGMEQIINQVQTKRFTSNNETSPPAKKQRQSVSNHDPELNTLIKKIKTKSKKNKL